MPFAQRSPEGSIGPAPRVGQHHTEDQMGPNLVESLQSDRPLAWSLLVFLRHTSSDHPRAVTGSVTGQEQAEANGNEKVVLSEGE